MSRYAAMLRRGGILAPLHLRGDRCFNKVELPVAPPTLACHLAKINARRHNDSGRLFIACWGIVAYPSGNAPALVGALPHALLWLTGFCERIISSVIVSAAKVRMMMRDRKS